MSPLSDEEVRRRMAAAAARIKARSKGEPLPEEIDVTPTRMPKPAASAPLPPAPWQDREPGDDREP